MLYEVITLTTSSSFMGFATDTVMVVLFVVFLLLEIGHFKKRIELAFEGIMSTRIQRIVADVIKQVARYLSRITSYNVCYTKLLRIRTMIAELSSAWAVAATKAQGSGDERRSGVNIAG